MQYLLYVSTNILPKGCKIIPPPNAKLRHLLNDVTPIKGYQIPLKPLSEPQKPYNSLEEATSDAQSHANRENTTVTIKTTIGKTVKIVKPRRKL
jgi:hypothetical protein